MIDSQRRRKFQIREEIKEKLNKQDEAQRLDKSRLIKEKLFNLAEFKKAKYVMFYVARDEEVQTDFMISEARKLGKKIAVPVILKGEKKITASLVEDMKEELTLGPYGILQPKSEYIREIPGEKIDLVIVPGIAFNRKGGRLGRGAGYYDRFLASLPGSITRIGLAFDFQILEDLPLLTHDISVTAVLSA